MPVVFRLSVLLLVAVVVVSCGGDPMLQVRRDFAGGRYDLARAELSKLAQSDSSDRHVWQLERSIASIALGRPGDAIDDLRQARDQLEELQGTDYAGWFRSVLLDDRQLAYQGADFEIVLVRAVLALAALMGSQESDAGAYALQVAEKQQQIMESFQASDGTRSKDAYKLVAFGSYLRAILDEGALKFDTAAKAYERVRELEPSFAHNDANLERVTKGHIAAKGNGVVHVLALVGRGPFRVESSEPVTRNALAIAQYMWSLSRRRATIPNIADVKIPRLAFHTDNPSEVHVETGGKAVARTAVVTDIEETARREFDAMYSHVIARAVLRRAFKIVVTEGVKEAVRPRRKRRSREERPGLRRRPEHRDERREYGAENVLADLAISGAGILWAALESANLRCWSLLPASFQVARVELPAGEHELVFRSGLDGRPVGSPQRVRVSVADGHNSYVTVMTPTMDGGPAPISAQALE